MIGAEEKTLKKIFGDTDSYYKIPDYQRPYAWEDEQVEQLWDDLEEAFHDGKKGYFLGSLILTEHEGNQGSETGGEDRFDVVDGQQRLITLCIAFCVLRDILKAKIEEQPENAEAKKFLGTIEEYIRKSEQNRVIIRAADHLQGRFEDTVINSGYLESKKKRITKKDRKENKFLNTALIFDEKYGEFLANGRGLNRLIELINYILNKIQIMVLICEDRSTAIKVFQSLNAKGLDLSHADLIKSEFFTHIKDSQRGELNASWQALDDTAEDSDISVEDVFTYYMYYLLARNPDKDIYKELTSNDGFKQDLKEGATYTLRRVHDFAKKYKEIEKSNNKAVASLTYLRHKVYWPSILTTAAYHQASKIDWKELAKSLCRFYYLYWIAGHSSNKIKQISYELIADIKKGCSINDVNIKLEKKLEKDRVIPRAVGNLEENVYGERWLKPLLVTVEMSLFDDLRIWDRVLLEKNTQIEHILPQKPKKDDGWQGLTNQEEKQDKLGNLTLLSGKKNIEASNKSFSKKVNDTYNKEGIDGKTGFEITSELKEHLKNGGWDDAAYQHRMNLLYDRIEKVFDIEIPREKIQ